MNKSAAYALLSILLLGLTNQRALAGAGECFAEPKRTGNYDYELKNTCPVSIRYIIKSTTPPPTKAEELTSGYVASLGVATIDSYFNTPPTIVWACKVGDPECTTKSANAAKASLQKGAPLSTSLSFIDRLNQAPNRTLAIHFNNTETPFYNCLRSNDASELFWEITHAGSPGFEDWRKILINGTTNIMDHDANITVTTKLDNSRIVVTEQTIYSTKQTRDNLSIEEFVIDADGSCHWKFTSRSINPPDKYPPNTGTENCVFR